MAFYSHWYEQSVSKSKKSANSNGKAAQTCNIFDKSQTDLIAAQVTVSSVQDKLIYNLEIIKPTDSTKTVSTVSDTCSTSSTTSQLSEDSLWDDWVVKFINNQVVDEDSLEEWIFDTTS
ncbi:1252_t:CDS:2 [Ambispora gerdemannii]|uniref:1252_t:CDS:1 n=1 Tax=Ambispora gerdemannii TaxID=144530 RepID=A0A9N9FKW7_9GLOM|nr:1252_t:CDS:2 [Ambispora gerdemannii]